MARAGNARGATSEHSNERDTGDDPDCLAAGIPTVRTALGSARELPDDVVAKVEEKSAPIWPTEMSGLLADRRRRQAIVEAGLVTRPRVRCATAARTSTSISCSTSGARAV